MTRSPTPFGEVLHRADRRLARRAALAVALTALACAGALPPPPAAGTASVWGTLRLVPREGVTPGSPGRSAYGDRRLRDVEFVDYEKPGFAVVFLERGPAPGGELRVSIEEERGRVRLDPLHGALGAGGVLVVANRTSEEHVVSDPTAGMLRRVGAGEELAVTAGDPGIHSIFLLDAPGAEATVFVSPGPYSVASERGRFELRDLAPGPARLRAWHPRFPTASRPVDLVPGRVLQIDLELTVAGLPEGGRDHRGH